MYFVETQKDIDVFLGEWTSKPSQLIPVFEDLEKHPLNNKLCFLYIRIADTDYVISYTHSDCISVDIDLSTSYQVKWCWGKKNLLHTDTNIQNIFDIQSYNFFIHNKLLEFDFNEEPIINHYHRLGVHDGLGKVVPIMKWGEILKRLLDSVNDIAPDGNIVWVNNTVISVLSRIERYGLCVDIKQFSNRFPTSVKHLDGDRIYTEYNPYTITSRPSNRHGGVNFSALNKSDGSRDVFIPKKDSIFLQFDYDAYHIRIIAKLIGYKLPSTSAHQWLADQYGTDYDEGKSITFKLLYGGIPDEFKEISYFKMVDDYINEFWKRSTEQGYIQTKFRRIPLDFIEEINPQKAFNYLLQATETELNMYRMGKVLDYIKNTDIELNLYVYDSLLFSYPNDIDTKHAIQLKHILEGDGFPVRVSWGMNYGKV